MAKQKMAKTSMSKTRKKSSSKVGKSPKIKKLPSKQHVKTDDADNVSAQLSESAFDSDSSLEIDYSPSPPGNRESHLRNMTKKKSVRPPSSGVSNDDDVEDEAWEQAVQRARGLPDGGASDDDEEKHKATQNSTKKNKKTEKRKPFKALQGAAGKIKKLAGKKRNLSGSSTTESEAKKPKLEELSKKERKKQRKMKSGNYEVGVKAKRLWEQIRRHKLSKEKRQKLCDEARDLVKGKAKELVMAHDTSRVIQCLMKYGSQEHRDFLFEELRDEVLAMTKSKYAKFFIRKLLKYGSNAQRNYVFRCFHGNMKKLLRHKESAEIVEYAYNNFANASQRAAMIEEFYGPSFALFKTPEAKTLDQIMKSSPEKRDTILSNMKETLSVLVDKEICIYSMVHKLFLEYFTYASQKQTAEMIEVVRESLIHMLHTRDGAHVAMKCIWNGSTKDRKVIMKSMKSYVLKISKEEYGHLVLLAMLDSIDDTKMLHKVILEELLKSVTEVGEDNYGRKVLLYLLAPRDQHHFHPDIIKILEGGDGNQYSKKDTAVRRDELLTYVSPGLLNYICENTKSLLTNNATTLLLMTILTHAKGDLEKAMKAVCTVAEEPFEAGTSDNYHIVENTAGHLSLKKLIMNDQERMKRNESLLFSVLLVNTLPDGALKSWAACNRGCFVLVNLLELKHPEVTDKVVKEIQGIKKSLSKLEFKGAQILLEKLG